MTTKSLPPIQLPEIPAPDLSGLEVTVPAPPVISQEQVLKRLHDRVREGAKRRDRAAGERLAPGDDVQLTIIGYSNEKLIPDAVRVETWEELAPWPAVPTFFERLVEAGAVGKRLQITAPLRNGTPARFLVAIVAAREVEVLDPDDSAVLRRLGLGTDIEAAVDKIVQELEDELVEQLQQTAQRLVLDALAARISARIPRELIDRELTVQWERFESQLAKLQLDAAERASLMYARLNDGQTRTEAERRLRIALALRAIGRTAGITPNVNDAKALVREAAAASGLEASAKERDAPELLQDAANVAHHLALVDYVLKQAKVRYAEPAAPTG